jgi:hypothetical protein
MSAGSDMPVQRLVGQDHPDVAFFEQVADRRPCHQAGAQYQNLLHISSLWRSACLGATYRGIRCCHKPDNTYQSGQLVSRELKAVATKVRTSPLCMGTAKI